MAVLSIDFCSSALKMNTVVCMAVPDSVRMDGRPLSSRPVVYLLHGRSDDATSWLRLSNVERYARERDLVLVMPSCCRSMYCDGVGGQDFFTYVVDELPGYLHLLMGIATDCERTFVVGNSMGGYGAARAGLLHPERYAAWGSLSGILDLSPLAPLLDDPATLEEYPFLASAAGSLATTPLNPSNLLDPRRSGGQRGYVACGLQDDLLPCSKLFEASARSVGADVIFDYAPGGHDWSFWDTSIRRFLDFIGI